MGDPTARTGTPGISSGGVVIFGLLTWEWTITTKMVDGTAVGVMPALYVTMARAEIGEVVGEW